MEITSKGIINVWEFADKRQSQECVELSVSYYQRPFKWKEEHIKSLFEDFFGRSGGHYFVGTVIAYAIDNRDTPERAKYEIVDGQQRLTVLFLLNYLRFIIGRSYIEEKILLNSDIQRDLERLITRYKGFFGNNMTTGCNSEKMQKAYDLIEQELEKNSGSDYKLILQYFRDAFGMCNEDESDPNYVSQYRVELKKLLDNENFVIWYDRLSLNQKLRTALEVIRFSCSERDLFPPKKDWPKDQITNKYIETIMSLYGNVRMKVNEDLAGTVVDDVKYAKLCLECIDAMLDKIQICLLTSNSQDDAYTLFEVLNDRGCEMSDLELVKNMFLSQYWNNTSDLDKEDKIEDLDKLWDEVFDLNLPKGESELIAYLGTVYLSEDKQNTPSNIVKTYREKIKDKRFPRGRGAYNYIEAYNDIAFFSLSKIIIEEAELSYKGLSASSIAAENSDDKSVIFKTINLLHAVKCDGVLPILINVLINDYKNKMKIDFCLDKIDPTDFRGYARNAMKKTPITTTLTPSPMVYETADKVWKFVLLSKDYAKPREIASKIIHICWRDKYKESDITSTINLSTQVSEFKTWTDNWRYGRDDYLKHRIMIIMMRLMRDYEKKTTKRGMVQLETSSYNNGFKSDAYVNLDHLEPLNYDKKRPGDYYEEGNPDKRNDVINGIGNMMVFDFNNNLDKGNVPAYEGIYTHYSTIPVMARSYLLDDIKELLKSNSSGGTTVVEVPTDSFFEERKKRLLNYMEKMLLSDYKQSPISL